MSRWRAGLSLGVIAALVVAVWAAVASGDDDPAPSTTTSTSLTETTSTVATTTSTTPPTTTTTVPSTTEPDTTTDPEARLEEVRLIVQDLWFRWFDAIYRNDEEAVREVVATEQRIDAFTRAVDELDADRPPTRQDVVVSEVDVLVDGPNCLVVFSSLDLSSWRGEDAQTEGVDVLWPHADGWRRATRWSNKGDLWEADCEAERTDELP